MVDYRQFDDETLLRLIAYSQENALSELYDRYSRLVYSLAIKAVDNPSLAEEVTQDVFIRIWEKAETYQAHKGKVISWIASITRYRSIDLLRRQNVRPEGYQTPWDESGSADPADDIDLEKEVEISEFRRRMRSAINELPEEQRTVLAYAYFRGYSQSEIAQILNQPLGTVKTRIRLAMQKLRKILQD